MVLSVFIQKRWLAACTTSLVLTHMAYAQSPVSAARVAPVAPELTAPYPSAFKGYKPYTDDPLVNWKAANDTAASVGGWREYAKQAQRPENTPAPSAKSAPPLPMPDGKARP